MEEKKPLTDDLPPSYTATAAPLPQKGGYSPVTVVHERPRDYLWLSVFTIACCFWPISIVAILKSMEVRNLANAGKVEEARRASKEAKKYNLISICLHLSIILAIYVVTIIALTPVWILIARGNTTEAGTNETNTVF